MTRKKDSVALFEVMSKKSEAGRFKPETDRARAGEQAERPSASGDSSSPGGVRAPAETQPQPKAPTARVDGNRLRISLSYAGCIAASLAFLVLLGGAFMLGRQTAPGEPDGQGPTDPGGKQFTSSFDAPYKPEVTNGKVPPPDQTHQREKRKYYLVIQGMQGLGDQYVAKAQAILDYLKTINEPATLGEYQGNPKQVIVWSLRGFDRTDSPEALKFVAAIEKAGKDYSDLGGRYDFRQRDRAGRLRPWFIRF